MNVISSSTVQHNTGGVIHELYEQFVRSSGLIGLGEAYVLGDVELDRVEDIFLELIHRDLLPGKFTPRVLGEMVVQLISNPQRGLGAFAIGRQHYDLGNDLFVAMLDETMTYTCGYWRGAASLEEAQEAKLDRICKKLKLHPGMRVLDIGCGWGNFAHFAASRYGVSVVGLTVSKEQASYAIDRCKGLPVEILIQDYKTFHLEFDRVVSIEMIEAVGYKNLDSYFQMINQCLKPSGLAVIQAISTESFSRYSHASIDQFLCWLRKHIFPDGYIPNHAELIKPGRRLFVVEDIENFSADYEKTLIAWRSNFEMHWEKLAPRYGERFRRTWLYYLGGCIAFFRLRMVQLFQIVYAKDGVRGVYSRD